jgi:predicted deacylase
MSRNLIIGGVTIKPGQSRSVRLPVSETYVGEKTSIPLRIVRSKNSGPCVFVTAAIHGDEINGTGIIHDFLFSQKIKLLKGTVIFVPVVNVLGFEGHQRYLPDRRDLNRCFPGSPEGSFAGRIAHTFMSEVIGQCDYGIDLHTAAYQRTNYPNVRADLSLPENRRLAKAFGCALVIDGKGPVGSLRREATRRGCPTIILEAGEPWKIEPSVLAIGQQGIRNVLIDLGMLPGELSRPPFQASIRKTTWLRAAVGGIMKFHVSPGDFVEEGQPIITNYSILGREQNALASPSCGIILGMTTMPAVKPGEPVCHIARLSKTQLATYQRRVNATTRKDPHQVVQRALATNVDVVDAEG